MQCCMQSQPTGKERASRVGNCTARLRMRPKSTSSKFVLLTHTEADPQHAKGLVHTTVHVVLRRHKYSTNT
jgi:hypothetical protein